MNEHFLGNQLWLQLVYLIVLGLVGWLVYVIFCRRKALLKNYDFILLVKGDRKGDYKMSFSASDHITNEQAEAIIKQVLVETGKKNPTIVRLLFTGSLNALTEDDQVGMWFKEITGKDLKDQFKK